MTGNAIARIIERNEDICPPEALNGTTVVMGSGSGAMELNASGDPCALSRCDAFMIDNAITLSLLVGILMVSVLYLSIACVVYMWVS